MDHQFTHDAAASPISKTGQAAFLWMRAGIVGASMFALGVISLATTDAEPMYGLVALAAGAALAVYAWRRSWRGLNSIDSNEPVTAFSQYDASPREEQQSAARANRRYANDWAGRGI